MDAVVEGLGLDEAQVLLRGRLGEQTFACADDDGVDHEPEFVDETHTVYVVRIAADAMSAPAAIDQAETLMRWDLSNQPDLSAPIKLLEFVKGHAKLGPNLVQAVGAAG